MMRGRRGTWIVFIACVLGVGSALNWVTWHALRLERREREAHAEAKLQESVRLALWRMDSAVGAIITKEAARPYFHYQPFYVAGRSYSTMWDRVKNGDALVPSPLLTGADRFVRLYFQELPDGTTVSPQAPTGSLRALAEPGIVPSVTVVANEETLSELKALLSQTRTPEPERQAGSAAADALKPQSAEDPGVSGQVQQQQPETPTQISQTFDEQNLKEYRARKEQADAANKPQSQAPGRKYASTLAPEKAELFSAGEDPANKKTPATDADKDASRAGRTLDLEKGKLDNIRIADDEIAVEMSAFTPRWADRAGAPDPELLLVRTVHLGDVRLEQGLWVDWPQLRDWLLSSVADLFPRASLQPRPGAVPTDPALLGSRLASIPVEFMPGVDAPRIAAAWTPMRTTLLFTWAAVVAAVTAVGLVLRASMELAERRGQFVSAVTHELRTPLTTFCLYSQMLADGMVPEGEPRREYLSTLKQESQRLAKIVENVLEYARLGRRNGKHERDVVGVTDLLARIEPVLRRRLEQAGMELSIESPGPTDATIATEPQTVERILMNLVDNACKYAARSPDRRVHLQARVSHSDLMIVIRDHGPGIEMEERSRIFRPFQRGGLQQDGSIPGLGLGLSLSKSLAKELGGELSLVRHDGDGASFELRLPLTA